MYSWSRYALGIVLGLLLSTTPVAAMNQLLVGGVGATNPSSTVTNYMVANSYSRNGSATESAVHQIVSYDGTIDTFSMWVSTPPTSGRSYLFTVRKNAADTTVTCTIANTATTCSDITHTASFVAGDTLDISIVPTGSPALMFAQSNLVYRSTGSTTRSIYAYTSPAEAASLSGVRYFPINGGEQTIATTESNVQFVMPSDGSFDNFRITISAAPGGAASWTFTLRKNGSATAVTTTITGAATSGTDLVNSASVVAGDLISVSVTPAGGPGSGPTFKAALSFVSSTANYFLLLGNSSATSSSASATRYMSFSGVKGGFNATATVTTVAGQIMTGIKLATMVAAVTTAPDNGGGTQSYAVTLYNATGASATTATCTISEASTTCTYTGTLVVPTNLSYTVSFVPSGTPATTTASVGFSATLANSPVRIRNATIKNAVIR